MYHKTEDVIPSNWLGKVSTGVFFVVCVPTGPLPRHSLLLGPPA